MRRFAKEMFPNMYIGLVLIFLYLPIAILIVFSFNSQGKSFIWDEFTFAHYLNLFSDSDGETLLQSLLATLRVATIASISSTIIAVVSCLGMSYLTKKMQGLLMNLTYVPNVMPELVTGISFMLLFEFLGIQKGEVTLVLAHIAFCVPYAVLSINPKLKQMDRSISEAAMDLGATQWQTLRLVIIPEIMPGIVSAVLLTFTMSVDDYLVSAFNVDSTIQTLPMQIYSMAKFGVNPKMNALTTLLFAAVLVLLILSNISSAKSEKKKQSNLLRGE